MCEPFMLAKTGLTITEHQVRAVANYLELRSLAPDLPFVPVLQGWSRDDYHRCVELYERAGIDLTAEPRVGVGSVCRRQATGEIEVIVHSLASLGLRLHGFGVKAGGLVRYADCLASADSLAWGFEARRSAPLAGCRHANCANCLRYATVWRERVLARLEVVQLHLRMTVCCADSSGCFAPCHAQDKRDDHDADADQQQGDRCQSTQGVANRI
jgi:hypothetical protein